MRRPKLDPPLTAEEQRYLEHYFLTLDLHSSPSGSCPYHGIADCEAFLEAEYYIRHPRVRPKAPTRSRMALVA